MSEFNLEDWAIDLCEAENKDLHGDSKHCLCNGRIEGFHKAISEAIKLIESKHQTTVYSVEIINEIKKLGE